MTGKPIKLARNDRFDADTMLLVFIHVPKSGGTSFHAGLTTIGRGGYLLLEPGSNNPPDIDLLWGAGGHIGFEHGLVARSRKDRVYVTLVRDPLDRFVSFYKHVQQGPHHLRRMNRALVGMEPLLFAKALVDIGDTEISNLQCRMISGRDGATAETTLEIIERHYSICVPISRQQEALDAIAGMAGHPPIETQRLNTSSQEIPVEITPELVAFIEEVNSEDRKLFDAVSAPDWKGLP